MDGWISGSHQRQLQEYCYTFVDKTFAWQDIKYPKASKRKQDFSCIFAWQDIRYPKASKRKKDFSCIVLTQYPPLFSLDNGTRNLYVITTCLENRVAIICP